MRAPSPTIRLTLACVAAAGAVALGVAGTPTASRSAATRYLLLDTDLNTHVVDVDRFWRQTESDPQGDLRFFATDGSSRSLSPTRIAALLPASWDASSPASLADSPPPGGDEHGVLELVDGQRFVGRLAEPTAGAPTEVVWEHPEFGRLVVDLDAVRRVLLAQVPEDAEPAQAEAANHRGKSDAAGDTVVMLNGDRISGLVEAIAATVTIDSSTRGAGGRKSVPARQVARVSLENPARTPEGARAWLRDGSVVGVSRMSTEGSDGRITLELRPRGANSRRGAEGVGGSENDSEPRAAAASLDPSAILALTPDVGRLLSLASIPVQSQRPAPDRRLADPVATLWLGQPIGPEDASRIPLHAPDLLLPGPMSVEWNLPARAARLAGRAELPRECLVWGDCVLRIGTVSAAGQFDELASARLNAERPAFDFNVALDPPRPVHLRIEVDAGERGPIMDRVVLRRAFVLLR